LFRIHTQYNAIITIENKGYIAHDDTTITQMSYTYYTGL